MCTQITFAHWTTQNKRCKTCENWIQNHRWIERQTEDEIKIRNEKKNEKLKSDEKINTQINVFKKNHIVHVAINHSLASAKPPVTWEIFELRSAAGNFYLYAKHNELWNRTHNSFALCISLWSGLGCSRASIELAYFSHFNLMKLVEFIKSNKNSNQEITISNSSY